MQDYRQFVAKIFDVMIYNVNNDEMIFYVQFRNTITFRDRQKENTLNLTS